MTRAYVRFKYFLRQNRAVLRSYAIFTVSLAAFLILRPALLASAAFNRLVWFTTMVAAFILRLVSIPALARDATISARGFSVEVIAECTGLFLIIIFTAAVLAYPTGLKQKLAGTALGIGAIYSLNLVRIVGLFCIGLSMPGLFDSAHLVLGQGLIILFTIFLWLWWANRVSGQSNHKLVAFALRATACFVGLYALWLLVGPVYDRGVVFVSDRISPAQISLLSANLITLYNHGAQMNRIDSLGLHAGIVLLLSLVAVWPGWKLSTRVLYALAGLVLAFVLNVAVLVLLAGMLR